MNIKRGRERQSERIEFARSQRRQSNEFSHDMWQMLRGGRVLGAKFRRESPLGPYTLDFACLELKLDIEIDGKDHGTAEGRARDAIRDEYVSKQGYTVMRIEGFKVTQDFASVRTQVEAIVRTLQAKVTKTSPSPPDPLSPSCLRGEGEKMISAEPITCEMRGETE